MTVNTSGSDNASYTVTAIDGDTGVESLPGIDGFGWEIAGASQTNPVTITTNLLTEFEEGQEIYIDNVSGMTELNKRRFIVTNNVGLSFDLKDVDGTEYGAFTSATYPAMWRTNAVATSVNLSDIDTTLSWDAVPGAIRYTIYREVNGLFSYIGSTTKTTFSDDNIDPDVTQTPPIAKNPFLGEGNYPGAVGFHQQRRLFGGSLNEPNTWRASKIGDYSNFATSFPIKDDDAIEFTLADGKINQIKHFLPTKDLALFTTGQEWSVSSGGEVAFSPLTAKAEPETNWGCADHRPFMVGKSIVFVQEDNRTVRSFGFAQEVDGFKSNELSLFSDHIFQSLVS